MRKRLGITANMVLATALAGCASSADTYVQLAPNERDLVGVYELEVPTIGIRGRVKFNSRWEVTTPDTVVTSDGRIIECDRKDASRWRVRNCAEFRFWVAGDRLYGAFRLPEDCYETRYPVTRTVRDPHTGESWTETSWEPRTTCRGNGEQVLLKKVIGP
ncbi:MAG: hypothetical protein GTN78_20810 [Gemmatimonadales bacterium]|nr:hypothetical protein [Gemmatimonadales bacterium]NIN10124.1 hypothetical protein [Gemmatimonadales bacterium]NIR02608.1 hypothetical protein [Gemmatimonadales bacterium]NIS66302.1 hypothetical protein [Gemmatimonadales bacterium]